MRINKYIASCGICSRRRADELVKSGAVTVNGVIVTDFADIAENDTVTVNGEIIGLQKTKYYIALNKPEGYITSVGDDRGRPAVTDLVSDLNARIFPVGRLDFNTSGLLLMTNDGDFANRVTHPRRNVYKTYIAHIKGFPDYTALNILRRGVLLDDGKTLPAKAEVIKAYPGGCDVKISIHEGRNRQIRRMFSALGFEVLSLCRTEVGNVMLGNIPLGRWRHLTSGEISFFA